MTEPLKKVSTGAMAKVQKAKLTKELVRTDQSSRQEKDGTAEAKLHRPPTVLERISRLFGLKKSSDKKKSERLK